MTPPNSGIVQATAVACSRITAAFEQFFSFCEFQHCSGIVSQFEWWKANVKIFIEDLPRDKLTARSVLWACVKDHPVRVAVIAFFAIFFLTTMLFPNIPQ